MRYFLTLSYRGTRYAGWQIQPNAPSVQATLEAALSTILREGISVVGCGRTDTGVHARYYMAHFDAENALPPTFLIGLNSLLPEDVAVHGKQLSFGAGQRSFTDPDFGATIEGFANPITCWFSQLCLTSSEDPHYVFRHAARHHCVAH